MTKMMTAQQLIDKICPEHDRTSCSDEELYNEGRCSRCTLMLIVQGKRELKSTYYLSEKWW